MFSLRSRTSSGEVDLVCIAQDCRQHAHTDCANANIVIDCFDVGCSQGRTVGLVDMTRLIISALCLSLITACQADRSQIRVKSATSEVTRPISASSDILVVYLSAWDCPPCITWDNHVLPEWKKSKLSRQVKFYKLEFPTFGRTDEDQFWPEKLRWIRSRTEVTSGTPRWIVAVNGHIISNQKSWGGVTRPLIQHLVAQRTAEQPIISSR